MYVRDESDETRDVRTAAELEEVLARRYDIRGMRANSFWMCHETDWPALSMLVRDDLAVLDYMSDDGEGRGTFVSKGTGGGGGGEMTLFIFGGQDQPVVNYQIIPFAEAVRAAKEFLASTELPTSIQWDEL
jgi:hypothetical protein